MKIQSHPQRILLECFALTLVAIALIHSISIACNPSFFPPGCGKSTAIVKSSPTILVNVPPRTQNIATTITVARVATNGGDCPEPVETTVRLVGPCPIGGGLPGSSPPITIPTPIPGTYQVNVPITWGAGTPGVNRRCNIAGTATTLWDDGTTTIGAGDTVVCIVDPVPGTDVPRLDMALLTPPSIIAHPGDQGTARYRITNNDPEHSVSLTLTVDSVQAANMPTTDSPDPVGSPNGPFAIAAPFDHFPIAFLDQHPEGYCIPLVHPQPGDLPPEITMPLSIEPGSFEEIEIAVRSFPMCSSGSCAEQRLFAEGTFADGGEALACGGLSYVADSGVPPTFQCPDSGRMATTRVNAGGGGGVDFYADLPDFDLRLGQYFGGKIAINGAEPLFFDPGNPSVLDNDRSHIRQVGELGGLNIQPNQPLVVTCSIDNFSFNPTVPTSIDSAALIPPHSGQNNHFTLEPIIQIQSEAFPEGFNPIADGLMQISLNGTTTSGESTVATINPETIEIEIINGQSIVTTFQCTFEGNEEFESNSIDQLRLHNNSLIAGIGVMNPNSFGKFAIMDFGLHPSEGHGFLTFPTQLGRHYQVNGSNDLGRTDPFSTVFEVVATSDTTTVEFEDPLMIESPSRTYLVAENTSPLSEAPCAGATLLVVHAFWDCRDGKWVFIERATWQCPDTSIVDTEAVVQQTNDPCTSSLPTP